MYTLQFKHSVQLYFHTKIRLYYELNLGESTNKRKVFIDVKESSGSDSIRSNHHFSNQCVEKIVSHETAYVLEISKL